MNVRDSEALTGLFLKQGYVLTDDVDNADVVVLNTCAVRDNAQNRAVWTAATLKRLKTRDEGRPLRSDDHSLASPLRGRSGLRSLGRRTSKSRQIPIIAFIGCVAQREGEALFKKYPHIDLILGTANLDKAPEYIKKIQVTRCRILDVKDTERNEEFYHAEYRDDKKHAQVVISTGCSNYCTYCVVPSARGGLRLRKPEDILEEVRNNVASGRTKIMLLGQNVNDYNYTSHVRATARSGRPSEPVKRGERTSYVNFVALLKMVEQVPGIEEIKFMTSNPKNTTPALFDLMAQSTKILKDLHLPFQAGSDKILKKMNRGYTRKEYLKLITDYRRTVKGSLGTDIIVGFPGETEKDFTQTIDIMKRAKFDYAFIFKYSPREGTEARRLADDVPAAEKERRHKILLDLLKEIASNKEMR